MVKVVGRRHHGNSRTSHDALTRQQYEDPRFAREYRRRRGDRPRPYEKRLLRQLLVAARERHQRLHRHDRRPILILDVGTGYGRDLAWLQAQPGITAVGVDYAITMLRLARKALPLAEGTLAQMDVRSLGLKSGCMDVVRAQAVLHHLTPRAVGRAMREVVRILKPGGLARVFVRRGTWQGRLKEPGLGYRYFQYFTLKKLCALLRRHGLRPLSHEMVVAFPKLPCLAILAEKPLITR